MAGMSYMLSSPIYDHQIHLGFRNSHLVVRAVYKGRVLELIPPDQFGTVANFDLPASLLEKCVHWLDLKTGVIEIRHELHIWKAKDSNWQINFNTRLVSRTF